MLNLLNLFNLKRLLLLRQFHIVLFYVLQFHVLLFHALQFGPSISRPSFSRPAFSAPHFYAIMLSVSLSDVRLSVRLSLMLRNHGL